jgi:SAM-dependent methyltransferase
MSRIAHDYQGADGEQYYAYQSDANFGRKQFETWKFEKYITPTDTIVDFGCGAGLMLKYLTAAEKLGIEVNPAASADAARNGIATVSSASDISDGFADVVISNHALEHTIRPLDELEALKRILKPTGKLVICVPFDDWRMQRVFKVDMDEPNHHLYTWSPLLLRNLLNEAGYAVLESRIVRFTWPPFTTRVGRLGVSVFRLAGGVAAFARQSRQVIAVAEPM